MTTDLDELEALAKAAIWTGEWHDAGCNTVECKYPEGSDCAGEYDEIAHPVPLGITGYIAAAQPKAILSLIAEVRALREDAERWRTEMALRNDPTAAIMFTGTNNRCCIYRGGVLIAPGSTYVEAIDTARRVSE